MNNTMKLVMLLTSCMLYGATADHLIFTQVVIEPTGAEMVIISNPTGFAVDLSDYYLTDASKSSTDPPRFYYNLPSGEDYWSGDLSDFIVRFPEMTLGAGASLYLSLHDEFMFASEYGYAPDLSLQEDMRAVTEGEIDIPFSVNIGILDSQEMLMLFHWDGVSDTVQDVDYFLWGNNNPLFAVDKTDVPGYLPDTAVADQVFLSTAYSGMIYRRLSNDETGEVTSSGNGITGHNETSELFTDSWRAVYNPTVLTNIGDILNGNVAIGANIVVQGLVMSFADKRSSGGPQVADIEDDEGNRVSLILFNEWDVPSSEVWYLFSPYDPSEYVIQVAGVLDYYEANNQWQVTEWTPGSILEYAVYHPEGDLVADESITKPSIDPAPYVIIPSLGERLDFSYSFPAQSRVIVRLYDAAGRYTTTLVDRYYDLAGTVDRGEDRSDWDGRDHLGQIVPPGTYYMHIEASDFSGGNTSTDVAPVVVGVRF